MIGPGRLATTARIALILAPVVVPTHVRAASTAVATAVFVEHLHADASGHEHIVLARPATVERGDALLFVMRLDAGRDMAPGRPRILTSPIPPGVIYAGAIDGAPLVSVDHGHSFAPLDTLSVTDANGRRRAAGPGDVTDIRWITPAAGAAGNERRFMFRGRVK